MTVHVPCVLLSGEASTRAARDLILAGRLGDERFFCNTVNRDWFLASMLMWFVSEVDDSPPKTHTDEKI